MNYINPPKDEDEWQEYPDAPAYEVNKYGEVRNKLKGTLIETKDHWFYETPVYKLYIKDGDTYKYIIRPKKTLMKEMRIDTPPIKEVKLKKQKVTKGEKKELIVDYQETFQIGKYKGLTVNEVFDEDYLSWFANYEFFKEKYPVVIAKINERLASD